MARLTQEGEIFVLDLGGGENRYSPEVVREIGDAFAEVAATPGPRALVTTATGKIWSNGLDLDWLLPRPEQAREYILSVQELFIRLLTLPCPAVAAVQGHAFGAGAMHVLAHDYRVMRADRGFFCLPEADIGMPFTYGMGELIQAKLDAQEAHVAMTTAHRYGGEEAAAVGIVDAAVPEDQVLTWAMEKAARLAAKSNDTVRVIKQRMYAHVIEQLGMLNPGL